MPKITVCIGYKPQSLYYSLKINGNLFSAAVALAQLDLEVAATKGESVRKSTKKNLLSQLKAYQ